MHSKPAMIYVAEEIYNSISNIKKKNKEVSNIDAIEMYIGTDSYVKISSGIFHENLIENLKIEGKLDNEIFQLLQIQKKNVLEKLRIGNTNYFAKSSYPLSHSQNAFDLIWRMCESYELWCNETGFKEKISLNLLD